MSDTVSDISKRCASLHSLPYSVEQGRSTARHEALPNLRILTAVRLWRLTAAPVCSAPPKRLGHICEISFRIYKKGTVKSPAPFNKNQISDYVSI